MTNRMSYLSSILTLFLGLLIFTNWPIACRGQPPPGDQNNQYHIGWVWPDSLPKLCLGLGVDLDGNVYVSSEDGVLYGLDNRGNTRWSSDLDCALISGPIVMDSLILVEGTDDSYVESYHLLYCFDPNGRQKWKFTAANRISPELLITKDESIYVEYYRDDLVDGVYHISIDGRGGPIDLPNYMNPIDILGINSMNNFVMWERGFDQNLREISFNGPIVRNLPLDGNWLLINPPIMSMNEIYFSTDSLLFVSLDKGFDTLWTCRQDGKVQDALSCVGNPRDNCVLLGTSLGRIYKFDRINGRLNWFIDLGTEFGEIRSLQSNHSDNLIASGTGHAIAILDSSGNLIWNQRMDRRGRPGKPIITSGNSFWIIQEGLLFEFTTSADRRVGRSKFFPALPPRAEAEEELIDLTLKYIADEIEESRESAMQNRGISDSSTWTFPRSKLVIHAPVVERGVSSMTDLRSDRPITVWTYKDGNMKEVSNKNQTIHQYLKIIDDNPFGSYFYGYYAFGIDFVNGDTREARAYVDYYCGPVCGNGMILRFRKNASGIWRVIDISLSWIS